MTSYLGISRSTLLVTVIAVVAVVAAIVGIWTWFAINNISSNHDSSGTVLQGSWTKDNPLGFRAKVAYVLNPTDASCPFQPCKFAPTYMLKYISEKEAFLLGYSICNLGENKCVTRDQFSSQALSDPGLIDRSPEVWSSLRLGGEELHWKPGDTVNIKVKLAPAIIKDDNKIAPDVNKPMYLDLGESTIIQLESG